MKAYICFSRRTDAELTLLSGEVKESFLCAMLDPYTRMRKNYIHQTDSQRTYIPGRKVSRRLRLRGIKEY